MTQQNRVGFIGIQRTVGLIGDGPRAQTLAAFKRQGLIRAEMGHQARRLDRFIALVGIGHLATGHWVPLSVYSLFLSSCVLYVEFLDLNQEPFGNFIASPEG